MKPYNRGKPLISIHVPKCGGSSFRQLLKKWFGKKLYKHYFQQYNSLPPKHRLKRGICIHGHFNRTKGFGIMDYYPKVDQFITVLREPLEIAISNYFFWKKKEKYRQLRLGILKEGDEHDYIDIDDFFKKRPRSHILNFMPFELTFDNYKEILEKYFIYICVMEDLKVSVNILAEKLGFPATEIELINPSARDEELKAEIREEFISNNRLEYEIFNYVLSTYKQ